MVQTSFTWPHGGRDVFLLGSFNGWSERIPMFLMKGSDTIFQNIIDLHPGCYQYKFLVDGAWHVDQQQLCGTDEYGTISNIVVVRATSFPTPAVGSSSSVNLNDTLLPPLTNGEMDGFRQNVYMHLLSSTAYELMPFSGKVIALDVELDVKDAFYVMYESGLTVVPLWDESTQQMAGMLTASDFISALLQLHRDRAMFTSKELLAQNVSSWKRWKPQHHRDTISTTVPFQRRQLVHADPDESLAGVASRIIHNNVSAVPVIHSERGLLHVACLGGVLRNVRHHFRHHLDYLSLKRQPVGYLPVGSWAAEVGRTSSARTLITLHPNSTLSSALTLFLEAHISSIPIVDEYGNFLNMYSKSDIMSLARGNVYADVQLDQITVSKALEHSGERGQTRYKTCTRSDSLYHVIEFLSQPDVRRVVVVEASSRRVEGIITLRDVFSLLSN